MNMNAPVAFVVVVVVAVAAVVSSSGDNRPPLYYQPGVEYKYASEPAGYFPTEVVNVPVIAIQDETHNSKVVTFGLPEGESLRLPVSSAILLHVPSPSGEGAPDPAAKEKKAAKIFRPYNPISPSEERGSFSLLVKIYPDGKAGNYVAGLEIGDNVGFKQIKGNVKKFRHPFVNRQTGATVTRITMLAGGTGVAPMLQALHPILAQHDGPAVRLLYGNRSPTDVMLRPTLDGLQQQHPDRFAVHYVIGETAGIDGAAACRADGTDADGECDLDPAYEHGWIDEEKIRRLGYPPAENGTSVVWICGVDDMYVSLAGSRLKAVAEGSPVHNLGFSDTDDTVWRS